MGTVGVVLAIWAFLPAVQEKDPYVPLLKQQFLPRATPWPAELKKDSWWSGTRTWFLNSPELGGYLKRMVALPRNGPGYRAIGEDAVLWGQPELVYGFQALAGQWAKAGLPELRVYALSPRTPVETGVDNAEGTFWVSHMMGIRTKTDDWIYREGYFRPYQGQARIHLQLRQQYFTDAGTADEDVFHLMGNSLDFQEFQSEQLNRTLASTIRKGMNLKTLYIYDMQTEHDAKNMLPKFNSPMHVTVAPPVDPFGMFRFFLNENFFRPYGIRLRQYLQKKWGVAVAGEYQWYNLIQDDLRRIFGY